MLVRAKHEGYYDNLRRKEGVEFELKPVTDSHGNIIPAEKQFSSRWMEKLESEDAVPSAIKAASKSKTSGKAKESYAE